MSNPEVDVCLDKGGAYTYIKSTREGDWWQGPKFRNERAALDWIKSQGYSHRNTFKVEVRT